MEEVAEVPWLAQPGEKKVRGALMASYTFLMGTLTLLKGRENQKTWFSPNGTDFYLPALAYWKCSSLLLMERCLISDGCCNEVTARWILGWLEVVVHQ